MLFASRLGQPMTAENSPLLSRSGQWVHDTVDGIFLAGNVDRHGVSHPALCRSEYWHHDNDWADEKTRRLFNILHTVVLPETPGPTSFIDVRHLRSTLLPEEELLLSDASVTVKLSDIADYDGGGSGAECPPPPPATHKVLDVHPASGIPVAYMPDGTANLSNGAKVPSMDIFRPIINRQPLVTHMWAPGDVLVWDNLSVMHRSAGGYKGPRLLYRSQSIWEL